MTSRLCCVEFRRIAFAFALGGSIGVAGVAGCRTATPAGAQLVVEAPADDEDADVFVDGSYVGRVGALTNGKLPPVELAPGVHRVEVRKAGRFPVQRTVRVERAAPATIVIDAELLEDPR